MVRPTQGTIQKSTSSNKNYLMEPTNDYLMESKKLVEWFWFEKKLIDFLNNEKPKEQGDHQLDKKSMCHIYMISFFIARPTQGTIQRSANSNKI